MYKVRNRSHSRPLQSVRFQTSMSPPRFCADKSRTLPQKQFQAQAVWKIKDHPHVCCSKPQLLPPPTQSPMVTFIANDDFSLMLLVNQPMEKMYNKPTLWILSSTNEQLFSGSSAENQNCSSSVHRCCLSLWPFYFRTADILSHVIGTMFSSATSRGTMFLFKELAFSVWFPSTIRSRITTFHPTGLHRVRHEAQWVWQGPDKATVKIKIYTCCFLFFFRTFFFRTNVFVSVKETNIGK